MENILAGKFFINRKSSEVEGGKILGVVNDNYVLVRFMNKSVMYLCYQDNTTLYPIERLAMGSDWLWDVEIYDSEEVTWKRLQAYDEDCNSDVEREHLTKG
jgi:hypothetical protein